MAKESVLAGTTSHSVNIFIQDSSSTTGAGLSGLAFNTASLVASYTFTGANATRTAITLATLAAVNSAFSSGGFKEIDATNMKGGYRLDIPNAALAAASGQTVTFELHGATNMAPCWFEIELTAWNNQDGVRGGMTALPNAAAGASGGLVPIGTGANTFKSDASANVTFANTSIATVTTLTNLPAITANWLTAAGINAGALNGKGDWSTVTPSNLTAAQIATGIFQDTTASDFTTAGSIGKSIMNGVALGTGLTINGYTGNTPQTGDAFLRIGAAGVSLSAIPDLAGVTTLLARLTATRAGYIDNLSAGAVALASGVTVTTNNDKTGYALTSAEEAAIADAILGRNVAGGSSTGRLVKEALYVLRNKTDIAAGTLTVYGVDDTTAAFTAVVTTSAGNPISTIDPA